MRIGIKHFADLMVAVCMKYLGLRRIVEKLEYCKEQVLVDELMEDTLYKGVHLAHRESFVKKAKCIMSRFKKL